MSRRLTVPILLLSLVINAPAHATAWWLYMGSTDKCIDAAQFAKAVGNFTASPDALTQHYRSEGLKPTQHRYPKGTMISVDAGDGTGLTMFFSSPAACESFKQLVNHPS